MTARGAAAVGLWLAWLAAAAWVVAHARYVTDLSAFLPAHPTPEERLLVQQLRDGPVSRLLLMAIEGGEPRSRARVSQALAARLQGDPRFASIANGDAATAQRDRDFLFAHRYLLSAAVNAQHFSADGLRRALAASIETLASPAGLLLEASLPHDPTGEMLEILQPLQHDAAPRTAYGVWVSRDGTRCVLAAQTLAPGSDTDGQEQAIAAVQAAFRAAGGPQVGLRLRLTGPGVFAVDARARIKNAALRLSLVSGILVVLLLLAVYRSPLALALGLLPVATGALTGIAAVALVGGAVHGITLGFGITLIGEAVDYSIYFFVAAAWRRQTWPTVRLGMLTSVCGFATLLPAGFPGLAQLGVYSISGLTAAALVTRFVLPPLLPRAFRIRDVAPFGRRVAACRSALRAHPRSLAGGAVAFAALALATLYAHRDTLWNRELAALSPVPARDLEFDAGLRADLGAADVSVLLVVDGADLQSALRGAERAEAALQPLLSTHRLGDLDSPAHYLPSSATQQARRAALPAPATLQANLRAAAQPLGLDAGALAPFVADVASARNAALLTSADLHGTSLDMAFRALLLERDGLWSALLPLQGPADGARRAIDVAAVRGALAQAHLAGAHVIDLKVQADALYAGYLSDALRLSLLGFLAIVLLLGCALRSLRRVVRLVAPLGLAVATVGAALTLAGVRLNLLHLVGLLLIVAVGSNYALFFDAEAAARRGATPPLTLASLVIANLCTVCGFGLLAFSHVPVLEALGTTVAPGAFLALLFSGLLPAAAASREARDA